MSPTEIHAQLPGFADTSSVSLYVWTRHADHTVTVTTPVSVTIVPENPGIFATGSKEPRVAVMTHGSPYASGTISVDGTVNAGDMATIKIASKSYPYTVVSTDTLESIRDNLIALVNKDATAPVVASKAGVFTRIILQAKVAGKAGESITFSVTTSSGAKVLLSPTGINGKLCCANTGAVTASSPAIPGETITIYATGLGLVKDMTSFKTGKFYPNGRITEPLEFVSSLAGGKTANVLQATPMPGMVGVFEVQLELNSGLPADQQTQLTIAQNIFVSNIVTFPVTGTVSTPVASPVAGTYSGAQKVSLTAANSTSIYYTTNGVNPTCSGTDTLYRGAISVSSTETIKAIGCRTNWKDSAVLKAVYTIT